mmetsp:Transcript_43103/g.131280  ORF Transcript_43103/g.131280 Transcript_43103/m.131280 type:complete len:217 (-) Transcript_43103:1822-2472(-)
MTVSAAEARNASLTASTPAYCCRSACISVVDLAFSINTRTAAMELRKCSEGTANRGPVEAAGAEGKAAAASFFSSSNRLTKSVTMFSTASSSPLASRSVVPSVAQRSSAWAHKKLVQGSVSRSSTAIAPSPSLLPEELAWPMATSVPPCETRYRSAFRSPRSIRAAATTSAVGRSAPRRTWNRSFSNRGASRSCQRARESASPRRASRRRGWSHPP